LGGAKGSLAFKAPCRVATTAEITLSGFQTIDGVTLAADDANLRVLVKDQSDTTQNGVYLECFMYEVARLAGRDPLEFRRALMASHPKHLGVLNAVAERAGWGKPLPKGVFRGIAQFMGYASYSAAVAEVSVNAKRQVKVHRLVLGTDCGHQVNPDQIAAQVEGSVAYGLTAAFFGECTVDKGRIVETNFDRYRIMKLAEMPMVETVIAPTWDFWGGVGEPTICVSAPAVVNAIAAAIGRRGTFHRGRAAGRGSRVEASGAHRQHLDAVAALHRGNGIACITLSD
jgi:CO/xanthine dehydrogenase Mo-binding subunit